MMITGSPMFIAIAISERVPHPPETPITASAALTTRKFLALSSEVGMGTSIYLLASDESGPGSIPTVNPPASLAPLDAASITPPFPPQISIPPVSAIFLPTCVAKASTSGEVVPSLPQTAILGLSREEGVFLSP
jgi:hypothetical protein